MSGFKSLGRACPICDGARRDCRENLSTGFIHCRDASANPRGPWRYIKDDAHGFGMWVWGEGDDNRDSRPAPPPTEPSAPAVLSWPIEQRDSAYRAMAGKLALVHRLDIGKRPHVTAQEIDALVSAGVLFTWPGGQTVPGAGVGLPGVKGDGRLMGRNTWAVGVPNLQGQIAGVQLRNPNGGYFWASAPNQGGAIPHIEGELPLGLYGVPQVGVLEVAEGYLKPALAQARYGGGWLGMAGGQWAKAPKQLRAVLEAHGITQIILNADGGAIQNPNVMGQYRALTTLLHEWGIPLKVRWWGQTEKSHGDVDEISPDTFHSAELLLWAEFEAMAPADSHPQSWTAQIGARLRRRLTPQASAKALKATLGDTPYNGHEYEPGQRLATWKDAVGKGFKFILDQSGTGSGKSHDTGLATPEEFGAKKLLYLSAGHYAPTAPTLGQWADVHGRHSGLTHDTQADGSTRTRRAKRREERVVPANCGRTDLINVLRAKHVAGADQASLVCNTCPLQEACRHSEGNGYGYLHQRKLGLAATRLRLHPDSAPGEDFDYADSILIWDEPGESFNTETQITVTRADIDATLARLAMAGADLLEPLTPLLTALRILFEAKQGKYGLGHPTILERLPGVPNIDLAALQGILAPALADVLDPEIEPGLRISDLQGRSTQIESHSSYHGSREAKVNLRAHFGNTAGAKAAAEALPKQWLVEFLLALQGQGRLNLSYESLTITQTESRHRSLVQAAKATIFLDATLTREDLALALGIAPEDIYCIREAKAGAIAGQNNPLGANLQAIQVSDLGRLGMQRGDDQSRRVAALVDHLRQTDPSTKVIDFKKFESDGAWWRDSRGSNAFQAIRTLVLVGTPCQNLAALQARWFTLTGQQPEDNPTEFEAWVNRRIQADILQGIGRLRANRRPGEALTVYLLTNLDLGLPNVTEVAAKDITLKAASKLEKTEMAIQAAVAHLQQTGAKVTQAAVAKLANVSQGYISRCFGALLQTLLGDSNSKSNHSEVADPLPGLAPLVWAAIDLADSPQSLVDGIADLLNGLVAPHHLLAILLSGPPPQTISA
ncbi:MAG: hypothetical protein RLZZ597_2137 [Cyanobacteriota bacterium]